MIESNYRELYEGISKKVPKDWYLLGKVFDQLDDSQSAELLEEISKNNWPLTLGIRKKIKGRVSNVIGLASGEELVEFDVSDESNFVDISRKDLFVYYFSGNPYEHDNYVPELNNSSRWSDFERVNFTVDGYFDDFWKSFEKIFEAGSFDTVRHVLLKTSCSYDVCDRMFDFFNYFLKSDVEGLDFDVVGIYEGTFSNFWAPSLKSLNVKNLYLTKDGVGNLLKKPKMPRLEELKLGPGLDVNGNVVLEQLKREKFRLKVLDVSGMSVSGDGYDSICRFASRQSLEELRVPTTKQDSKKFSRFCDEIVREDCFPALQRYSIGDKSFVKLDGEWIIENPNDSSLVLSSYLDRNSWVFM